MSYTIYESKVTTYYDGHCEDGEETPVYRDFDSAEEAVAQAKEAALRCLSHAVACPRRGDEGVEGAAGLGSELGLADAAGEEADDLAEAPVRFIDFFVGCLVATNNKIFITRHGPPDPIRR